MIPVVHGVVSWSGKENGCGWIEQPSVYAEVRKYIDWMHGHVSGEVDIPGPSGTNLIPAGVSCPSNFASDAARFARVMRGEEVEPHSWSWIVSIKWQGEDHCGGTIIK